MKRHHDSKTEMVVDGQPVDPTKRPANAPFAYADPNVFVRLADVQALLMAKIVACADEIDRHKEKVTPEADIEDFVKAAGKLAAAQHRKGALSVTRDHLRHLDPFTLGTPGCENPILCDRNGFPVEHKS